MGSLAKEGERERFSTIVEDHLSDLYGFASHEINARLAAGDLIPGEVTAEDIVDAALVRAYHEFQKLPGGQDTVAWLTQLVTKQLEQDVKLLKAQHARIVHLEEDIPETPPSEEVSTLGDEILDFYQPDEDQKLEDVIPDMTIPTPEEILENREAQRAKSTTATEVPSVFRNAVIEKYRKLEGTENV